MTGLTFPLFSCTIAIKGISSQSGPSSSSGYSTSQPFAIQSCNSFSYRLLIYYGTGFSAILFFSGAGLRPSAHFHVHTWLDTTLVSQETRQVSDKFLLQRRPSFLGFFFCFFYRRHYIRKTRRTEGGRFSLYPHSVRQTKSGSLSKRTR